MPDLLESIDNGVATLTLNRPEALNALSMDIRNGMLAALNRYADDDEVRCVVITGAGRAFSSGGDVKGMGDRAAKGLESRARGIQFSNSIPMLMRTHPKVIIAMVNGVAAGAGVTMAVRNTSRGCTSTWFRRPIPTSWCPLILRRVFRNRTTKHSQSGLNSGWVAMCICQ